MARTSTAQMIQTIQDAIVSGGRTMTWQGMAHRYEILTITINRFSRGQLALIDHETGSYSERPLDSQELRALHNRVVTGRI